MQAVTVYIINSVFYKLYIIKKQNKNNSYHFVPVFVAFAYK